MGLAAIDWAIIAGYLALSTGIALYYTRRASASTDEFFLSGRKLPWYLAGTTMVATTFAADTPLAITELVASGGIAANWLWWNMLIGGMLTTFFFARLWRRAGIMTDVEFVELRYSGPAAAFLRGFRAIYLGLVMNLVILGWVNLAMEKILRVIFPQLTFFGLTELSLLGFTFSSHLLVVGVMMALVAVYASMAGLWGVVITDAIQFFIAMAGTIVLAITALKIPAIGGIAGLKAQLPEWVFQFTPTIGGSGASSGAGEALSMTVSAFIAFLGVQWWASWYPGADPGGGGYVAQRMMSAKDEKHSLFATLWFTIAHYALRPWPWIIVALVSMVLYPDLPPEQQGEGFIMVMRDYLPAGLLGLLLAAFLAAYMSTLSTQMNWGASYMVNDLYRRFIRTDASEKEYVKVARYATVVTMVLSLLVTSKMDRISGAWQFILEASAGIGLVLILRWFWWRINAWSEIAAMIAPLVLYPFIRGTIEFPNSLFVLVAWSTTIWLIVTFLTAPTEEATLDRFYERIHPGGRLWGPVALRMSHIQGDTGYGQLLIDWFAGCFMVIGALFGIGHLILANYGAAVISISVSAISALIIYMHLSRIGWDKVGSK